MSWNNLLPDGGAYAGGPIEYQDCQQLCGASTFSNCVSTDAGALDCSSVCVGGRAPQGLASLSTLDGSAGSWVARMAQLETAAVFAFAQLADELEAHGLAQHAAHARHAAADELRHADAVTRLALRMGHCPAPVVLSPVQAPRTLEYLALDNAGEGCGRELFGAVVNEWQAQHATDVGVRGVMASIAADERAHATYSASLAQSLNARLTPAQRRRAREAQERTLTQLGSAEVSAPLRSTLGLMDAEQVFATARRLLETERI